jgi:hypothetical protein
MYPEASWPGQSMDRHEGDEMDLFTKEGSEVAKNLATSGGLILGGAWAFWRWTLSEYLRMRKEIPSFDGELVARGADFSEEFEVLTASCKWRNVGVVPLPVNTQATRFTIHEVVEGTPEGPIGPRLQNMREVFVRRPWEHWASAILEPGTNSELQAHFLLARGGTYVVSCRLEAATRPGKDKQVWVREVVWHSDSDRTKAPQILQVTS